MVVAAAVELTAAAAVGAAAVVAFRVGLVLAVWAFLAAALQPVVGVEH